jgi:photosystem II P680 reaction center D1 protein
MDSQGRVVNTWADILNRANFPLDLASGEQAPVALTAPSING